MKPLNPDENLPYHCARLLILIRHYGKPRSGSSDRSAIEGRMLLAKLDFFMRYPRYLQRAAQVLSVFCDNKDLGVDQTEDLDSVESKMVRYLYGPWDFHYYEVIGYMIGKGLVEIAAGAHVDRFELTKRGEMVVRALEADDAFWDLIWRAETVYRLFKGYSGESVRSFIYRHMPEVVNRALAEEI